MAPLFCFIQTGEELLHLNELIFPAADADLLRMGQTGLVLRFGSGVLKVIVMIAEALLMHVVIELAARQRLLTQAGIHAGLIQSQRVKEQNIPISGRMGASFSA